MQVTKVSANVRYSQDTGKGAWKVVELGVEGTIGPGESWETAQADLYQQLGCQLRTLWSHGHKNGPESNVEAGAQPEPPENTSPLLPGSPDRVQAIPPGRERLVQPQDG